jgi:hypothetical protein
VTQATGLVAAIRTLALPYVEMALVRADRLTATEQAMASTVRGKESII